MQVIILESNKEIFYYDRSIDDFVISSEPIECLHEFLEAARQRQLYNILRGTLNTSNIDFSNDDFMDDDSLLSEIF